MHSQPPNRRQVLRTLAAGAAGTAASATWVDSLSALSEQHAHTRSTGAIAAQTWKPRVLGARQNDQVIVLSELIIPETDTPGAKAAQVNRFVDAVLDRAAPDVRSTFVKGLAWIDARSKALFKKDLLAAAPAEQIELLTRLSAENSTEEPIGVEFFRALKVMTINGYYTTEIGLRRELGDPGQLFVTEFQGCDHAEHQ